MRRYYAAEIEADFAVHLLGMLLCRAASAGPATFGAAVAYSVGLLPRLGLSAAYHAFRASERREFLRRLDHAAIFVTIAAPSRHSPRASRSLWPCGLQARCLWRRVLIAASCHYVAVLHGVVAGGGI